MELDLDERDSQNNHTVTLKNVVCILCQNERRTYSTWLLVIHVAHKSCCLCSITYAWRCGKWNTLLYYFILCFKICLITVASTDLCIYWELSAVMGFIFPRKFPIIFTACSKLREVLLLALSVTFCFFLVVNQVSREPLNGFAPNSHWRCVWSLAWKSLKVNVKGQK